MKGLADFLVSHGVSAGMAVGLAGLCLVGARMWLLPRLNAWAVAQKGGGSPKPVTFREGARGILWSIAMTGALLFTAFTVWYFLR